VPLDAAIERAGEVRCLPILLTSATAVGGLLSSTFIARIVTPAIYKLLPPTIEVDARDCSQRGMIEILPSRSRIA
jgi:multidrug efflux pump subunit AcrB